MRLLVTGICGFVGSALARCFLELIDWIEILGVDSLIRPGSELNRQSLPIIGCKLFYGDVRSPSDQLTPPGWLQTCASGWRNISVAATTRKANAEWHQTESVVTMSEVPAAAEVAALQKTARLPG
jgi:nucleoside-diphosphate-sugar epimerase